MIGGAAIAAASIFEATTASAATPNIQGFGTSEELISGPMITTYTVSNLQPSSLAMPSPPRDPVRQAAAWPSAGRRCHAGVSNPMLEYPNYNKTRHRHDQPYLRD